VRKSISQDNKISFTQHGQKIYFVKPKNLDYISQKIEMESMFYESDILDWLNQQDIPTGDFIDVGANIGNHTIYFSKIMSRKVWAFEPYKEAYKQLVENLHINKIERSVKTFEFGLSSRASRASMILPKEGNNIGAAKVNIDEEKGNVSLKLGDEVLASVSKIALMKIDVEGHELDVLKGCIETIQRHKPVLLIECMNLNEYKKICNYILPIGYVPTAVFGATPMIVFRSIEKPSVSDVQQVSDKILEHYFDLDERFNKIRDTYKSLTARSERQATTIEEQNQKIKKIQKEKDVQFTQALNAKKAYDDLRVSNTYKTGMLILSPARAIKNLLKKAS